MSLEEDFSEMWSHRSGGKVEIVGGLNLSSLCEGKGVTFEVAKESDTADYTEDCLDNIPSDREDDGHYYDIESHKEEYDIPNIPFKVLSEEMIKIDDDGFLRKKVVKQTTGAKLSANACVFIDYQLFLEGQEEPFDSTRLRRRRFRLQLGSGRLIKGLEMAVASMRLKELSHFLISHQLAFGVLGAPPRIPQEATIFAEIELIDIIDAAEMPLTFCDDEMGQFDFATGISQAKMLHSIGNELTKKGSHRKATLKYRDSLKLLSNLSLSNDEEGRTVKDLSIKLHTNLAVTFDKLNQPQRTCIHCKEVLALSPNHVKALFHFGRAHLKLSNFDNAARYLRLANKHSPSNKEIANELLKLEKKKKASEEIEKICYKKALQLNEPNKENNLTDFEKTLLAELKKSKDANVKEHTLPKTLTLKEREACEKVAKELSIEVVFSSNKTIFIF